MVFFSSGLKNARAPVQAKPLPMQRKTAEKTKCVVHKKVHASFAEDGEIVCGLARKKVNRKSAPITAKAPTQGAVAMSSAPKNRRRADSREKKENSAEVSAGVDKRVVLGTDKRGFLSFG